jgi:hypothetical protein
VSREFLVALTLTLGCTASEPIEERGSWGTESLPAAACVGDGDGVIGPGELVSAGDLDLHATFIVSGESAERPADPWDLTPPLVASDRLLDLGPQLPEAFWFGDRFPEAGFVSLMDSATGTYGAHRLDEDGLWLLGLADEDETVLVYDPAVLLVPVPMAEADAWSVDAAAEGQVDGEEFPRDLGADGVVSLRHRWAFEVRDSGDVTLPIGTVSALRVRATVTTEAHNSAAGLVASDLQRVDLYIAECLGLVGRVRSRIDEPVDAFVETTEMLRLGLAAELRE